MSSAARSVAGRCSVAIALLLIFSVKTDAAEGARARDLGVPFEGEPGRWNAITDVPGVEVGQVTLNAGTGARRVGAGPVRSGVTVVLPLGRRSDAPVMAGFFNLNGNGEMTAQSYLQNFGVAYGPIGISNAIPAAAMSFE